MNTKIFANVKTFPAFPVIIAVMIGINLGIAMARILA